MLAANNIMGNQGADGKEFGFTPWAVVKHEQGAIIRAVFKED